MLATARAHHHHHPTPPHSLRAMFHPAGSHPHAPMPQPQPPRTSQAPSAVATQTPEYVSISTQHVYIGDDASVPMVARVSVCDYNGVQLFDSFVLPTHTVTDYRTNFTGLEHHHLQNGVPFTQVQQRVASLLRGKVVVGHQLWFDFAVLNISHLAIDTRDVALFLPFRTALGLDDVAPLQTLVWRLMRRRINAVFQHPVRAFPFPPRIATDGQFRFLIQLENARAALDLFRSHQEEWESIIRSGLWPCALPPAAYAPFFL